MFLNEFNVANSWCFFFLTFYFKVAITFTLKKAYNYQNTLLRNGAGYLNEVLRFKTTRNGPFHLYKSGSR